MKPKKSPLKRSPKNAEDGLGKKIALASGDVIRVRKRTKDDPVTAEGFVDPDGGHGPGRNAAYKIRLTISTGPQGWEKGKAMKEVRHSFDRACRLAGIHGFRFHDLRHSAASFMAMSGVDLMAIKQVLGHKTIAMTVRYSHLSPGHLRNAVAALDRAMTAPADPTSQFTSQSGENAPFTPDPAAVNIRI